MVYEREIEERIEQKGQIRLIFRTNEEEAIDGTKPNTPGIHMEEKQC